MTHLKCEQRVQKQERIGVDMEEKKENYTITLKRVADYSK